MRQPGPGDDYIAPAEAARLLKVSARTITRWAREGRIPSITTLGGHRRFPRATIEALALAQLGRGSVGGVGDRRHGDPG